MLRNTFIMIAGAVAPLGITGLYVYSGSDVAAANTPADSVAVSCCADTTAAADMPFVAAEPTNLPQGQMGDATVKGTIKFKGEAPKREAVDMKADGVCVKAHTAEVLKEDLIVGKDGGVKNVFVYLKKGLDAKYDAPKDVVSLDQHGCQYVPHVLGVMAGQKLMIKNSDETTHNVHSYGKKNKVLNQGQPAKSADLPVEWKAAEMNLWVKCDIHSWMTAVCHVVKNPFFAVTDDAGNFEIKNIPAGTYTFEALHETLGAKELEVKVDAKGSVEVKFPEFERK